MYWLEFAGEDDPFAALEARAAASDVTVVGPGVGTASAIALDRVRDLALTRAAGEFLGRTDADVASARVLLETAPLEREGTVAVRARDVRSSAGIDTQWVERQLGAVLVDRGFEIDLDDPDHTLRALFSAGALARDQAVDPEDSLEIEAAGAVAVEDDADDADLCVLGWVDAESDRGFGERAPTDRPFFQPGSMDPLLARALVNVAGARPGTTVVDPMCGTGGLLLESALVGARAVGVDAQAKMARGARENLDALEEGRTLDEGGTIDADGTIDEGGALDRDGRLDADGAPDATVIRGDATRLPLADDAADAVAVDAPYERQSKVEGESLDGLVAGALGEARRIAPRAVVVADRSWVAQARDAGWTVECVHRRRVHRSLVRHVHVLEDSPV